MIQKISRFTMFKNCFTNAGLSANKEIRKMLSKSDIGDIYQKKLPNGKIALLQEQNLENHKKSTTLIIDKFGVQNEIIRNKKSLNDFEIKSVSKKDFKAFSNLEKQIVYNLKTGKIEEKATRHSGLGCGVTLSVISRANRESKFPATDIAGSIHSTIYKKIKYLNGDTSYIEMCPNL